jgi:hypothetical protein
LVVLGARAIKQVLTAVVVDPAVAGSTEAAVPGDPKPEWRAVTTKSPTNPGPNRGDQEGSLASQARWRFRIERHGPCSLKESRIGPQTDPLRRREPPTRDSKGHSFAC